MGPPLRRMIGSSVSGTYRKSCWLFDLLPSRYGSWVVDSRTLHALAATLLESPSKALSATSAKVEAFCAKERAFDIILLAVSGSTLGAMVLAAHLRAIERQKPHPRRAAIIACTVRSAQYLDCLVARSGLSGALNLPWTPGYGACVS
jgi:hypothetical protein